MAKDRVNIFRGRVLEALPNLEFKVDFGSDKIVRCYTAGKMKTNKIFVTIGDMVDAVVPPGSAIGRIIKRL